MVATGYLILIVISYLLLLFALAYYAERKEKSGRSIVIILISMLSLSQSTVRHGHFTAVFGMAASPGFLSSRLSGSYRYGRRVAMPSQEDREDCEGKQDYDYIRFHLIEIRQIFIPLAFSSPL